MAANSNANGTVKEDGEVFTLTANQAELFLGLFQAQQKLNDQLQTAFAGAGLANVQILSGELGGSDPHFVISFPEEEVH